MDENSWDHWQASQSGAGPSLRRNRGRPVTAVGQGLRGTYRDIGVGTRPWEKGGPAVFFVMCFLRCFTVRFLLALSGLALVNVYLSRVKRTTTLARAAGILIRRGELP